MTGDPIVMRLAFLTTDNREQQGRYDLENPYFGSAMSALLEGFAKLGGEAIEVDVITCAKRRMSVPERLAPNIRFHQPIVSRLGWGRSLFLGCALAVRRTLKKIRPDVVHAQGTERDCGVSMMFAPRPRLLTIHGHMGRIAELTGARFGGYYWNARMLENRAVRKADGVLCITNYTRDRVESRAARTWVVPNAVDDRFFGVRSPAEGEIALCVGAICPWKRQNELIEALDSLPSGERPRLVFLGSGAETDYAARFRDLVSERDWCEHPGFVGHDGLCEWLERAAMLVLPSIEDNCPMVVLEAMAAGVPVAASTVGGIPDLVDDERTGLSFDPRKPDAMRKAVGKLVNSRSLRRRLADTARDEAERRFASGVVARQHLDIYHEVASR